jgi:hypothetical protein
MTIEERYSKGCEWLDENCPGWRDKINRLAREMNDAEQEMTERVLKLLKGEANEP